jgi:hypothetical protein
VGCRIGCITWSRRHGWMYGKLNSNACCFLEKDEFYNCLIGQDVNDSLFLFYFGTRESGGELVLKGVWLELLCIIDMSRHSIL